MTSTTQCSQRNSQEYPMYPDCLDVAMQEALKTNKEEAVAAYSEYLEVTTKAQKSQKDAQVKLAEDLGRILKGKTY